MGRRPARRGPLQITVLSVMIIYGERRRRLSAREARSGRSSKKKMTKMSTGPGLSCISTYGRVLAENQHPEHALTPPTITGIDEQTPMKNIFRRPFDFSNPFAGIEPL